MQEGSIRGNESLELSCVFTPQRTKAYSFRLACTLCAPGHAGAPAKVWLSVLAKGSVGAVSFSPHTLDFGDVALGDDSKDTVSFRGVLQTTISIKSEGPGPRQHGQGRRVHFDSVQAHT